MSEAKLDDVRSDRSTLVELELPAGRSFDAVGRLVTAGVASRAGIAVNRIDDLQTALHAVRRSAGTRGTTRIALASSRTELTAEVGPLVRPEPSEALEGVLSSLVDELETRRSGEDTWVVLRLFTGSSAPEGRCHP